MKLQAARKASGKTQKQVAQEAAVTERAYQNYEYGKQKPIIDAAIRIADALDVTDLRALFAPAPEDEPQSLKDIVTDRGGK